MQNKSGKQDSGEMKSDAELKSTDKRCVRSDFVRTIEGLIAIRSL